MEISFQVTGAPPSYLLSELAAPSEASRPSDESDPTDSGTPDWFPEDLDRSGEVAGSSTSALPSSPRSDTVVRNATWTPSASGATVQTAAMPSLRQEPVGEPGIGHDRAPTKRALVLEPYGPLGVRAVPTDLASELDEQDQYTVDFFGEDATYEASAEVFGALKSLASYDVVYISTHGSETGFAVSTAKSWYVKNPETGRYHLPEGRVLPPGVALSTDHDGVKRFFVTREFFAHHFPSGLGDTLFYADWCRSALGEAFRDTIQGAGSVYVGASPPAKEEGRSSTAPSSSPPPCASSPRRTRCT